MRSGAPIREPAPGPSSPIGTGEEAAVVEPIGGRAVPHVDLRGPETDAAQARRRRHRGRIGIAAAELGDALEKLVARGHGLALRPVRLVVVLEEARAEDLALPPEAEAFRSHGLEHAINPVLALHARPQDGERALPARLDLAPLGASLVEEQAETVAIHVA